MGVIRPNKFFSRDGVIQQIINTPVIEEPAGDVVTWITAGTQSVNEGVQLDLSLSATSSLGGTITYSKVGGLDEALFSLADSTLTLTSQNYESPSDSNANNQYIVIIRATSSQGGTSDRTITVTVNDVNEEDVLSLSGDNVSGVSPSWTVTVQNTEYGIPDGLTFNFYTNYLSVSNTDLTNTLLDMTISCGESGTATLFTTSGLTFTTGDGVDDNTMYFQGSIANINNALNGMTVNGATSIINITIIDGIYTTNYSIGISRTNAPTEQQLITFSNIPTTGTWDLGLDSNGDNKVILNYNDDADTIQAAMRAKANIAAVWGSLLTVTGNYTIGFTITAAKYGNLGNLYTDREMGGLAYSSSMSGYPTLASGWSSSGDATGGPNGLYAYDIISGNLNGNQLVLDFATSFVTMPSVKPTGYIITIYHAQNADIYESTNNINFTVTGIGSSLHGDNTINWGSLSSHNYGASDSLGTLGGNNGDWANAYAAASGGLLLYITLRNDSEYNAQASIDSALLTFYYNAPVTITQSTILDG